MYICIYIYVNSYGTYMDNICIMMYIESLGTLFGIWEAFGNFLLALFFGKFGRNFFVTLYLTSVRFLQMMAGNGNRKHWETNCQTVIHHFSSRYPSFFLRCFCSSSICYLAAAATDQLSSLRGGPSMSAGSASGSWDCSCGNWWLERIYEMFSF